VYRYIWSKAPQWGISCHPLVHIGYETLPLSVLTIIFSSRQTPTDLTGRLPRGLNSTTVLYELFSSTRSRSSQQPTRVLRQPSHELCLAPASTPTQLDPPLDFLKSKSESKSISSYDVNPIYTCPTGLRTKTNSLHCTAPSHLYSIFRIKKLPAFFGVFSIDCICADRRL